MCHGGNIANGTYAGLVIAGNCAIPDDGVVTVNGDVTLLPGSQLNAVTMATVHIRGNVFVLEGRPDSVWDAP